MWIRATKFQALVLWIASSDSCQKYVVVRNHYRVSGESCPIEEQFQLPVGMTLIRRTILTLEVDRWDVVINKLCVKFLLGIRKTFFLLGDAHRCWKQPPSLERFKTQLDKALSSDVAGPALSSGWRSWTKRPLEVFSNLNYSELRTLKSSKNCLKQMMSSYLNVDGNSLHEVAAPILKWSILVMLWSLF